MRLPRLRRPGLRARITLSFALGAAVLSALLAGAAYTFTRQNLLSQRDDAALSQVYTNARILQNQIGPSATLTPKEVSTDLSSLQTPTGSRQIVQYPTRDGSGWVATNTQFGEGALPEDLKAAVANGKPAKMRYVVDGEPVLAIGLPLTSADADYFEIISLQEIQNTLESLWISLVASGAVTVIAGAALGWWMSRRTLRPLTDVGVAAEAIAGGRLETRLEQVNDPDLAPLVTSFNHMASALEDRIDRDTRFASDVSHELRSPLMTLAASVEVLSARRDELPEGPTQSALELLAADVGRFQQLVEDLLEISRFDAGAARLDLQDVKLSELVMQSVSFSTGQEVPVDLDADLAGVVVRADKRRLVRVLANLLDNAAKYGGGATRVTLARTDNRVQLAVEDSGAGVPVEDREQIFARFSRGSASGRRSGTGGVGLGLALVTEHVRLHGGRAWAEERSDGQPGARFVVEIPVNPA